LPKMPERQLRFLLALETFTRGEDGRREIGTDLLARTAGLSVNTAVRARRELVKSGAIEYKRGDGRGHVSAYRIKVPHDVVHLPEPVKVPNDADHLSSPGKVSNDAGHLSEPGNVPKQAPERYPNSPHKGGSRNPAASGNASGALEPLALEASAARTPAHTRPRDPRLVQLLLGLGATDAQAELITARLHDDPGIHSPYTYALAIIGDGDGEAWLGRMLADLAAQHAGDDPRPPRPPKPPWCGECDVQTRLIETPDGPARCLRCHPLSVHPLSIRPSQVRDGQADDDDPKTRPERPARGYGWCPVCGRWVSVRLSGGRLVPHHGEVNGPECPGSRQRPAEPVPCARCGNTERLLTAIEGLCSACLKGRRRRSAGTP